MEYSDEIKWIAKRAAPELRFDWPVERRNAEMEQIKQQFFAELRKKYRTEQEAQARFDILDRKRFDLSSFVVNYIVTEIFNVWKNTKRFSEYEMDTLRRELKRKLKNAQVRLGVPYHNPQYTSEYEIPIALPIDAEAMTTHVLGNVKHIDEIIEKGARKLAQHGIRSDMSKQMKNTQTRQMKDEIKAELGLYLGNIEKYVTPMMARVEQRGSELQGQFEDALRKSEFETRVQVIALTTLYTQNRRPLTEQETKDILAQVAKLQADKLDALIYGKPAGGAGAAASPPPPAGAAAAAAGAKKDDCVIM